MNKSKSTRIDSVQNKNCSVSRKVTESRVNDFYKNLGIVSLVTLPVGEFKMYDTMKVTVSAGSRVQ